MHDRVHVAQVGRDRRQGDRVDDLRTKPLGPDVRIVLTEGNYLLHGQDGWDQLADVLDEVWYVDLPDDERLARLVARHAAFGKAPDEAATWAHGSDQANALLVQASRGRADLVVLR